MNWNPSWANAIASIESQGSGGYNAVGPVTQKGNRAYGKYQVMDFNIPSWTKKHLGQELTPDQFLRSPEAQDAVFKGEFGSSVAKYGNPQDAASVWFTGRPASEGANRSDILGTTGSKYVDKFNNALGTGATPTGGQQMMQPDQKPKGILSGLFGDEDKRARLAMALQGMTHNPNQGFMAAMQGGIEQRREDKLAATAEAKSEAQRNSTGKWLMDNGFKEIGAGVLSGAISGSAGLQMSQKAAPKVQDPYSKIGKLRADLAAGRIDQSEYNIALAEMRPKGLSLRTNADGSVEFVQGAGAGESFTQGESKDIIFAKRSLEALKLFDPVADALVSSLGSVAELDPTGMARYLQSDDYQKAQVLGKDFLAPILRKDTGAAVTPSEWVFYKAIYIPEVGDNPAKLAEKKKARARAVEAMMAGMNPAQILRIEGIDPDNAPKAGDAAPESTAKEPAKVVDLTTMSDAELQAHIEELEKQ